MPDPAGPRTTARGVHARFPVRPRDSESKRSGRIAVYARTANTPDVSARALVLAGAAICCCDDGKHVRHEVPKRRERR